MAKMQTNDLEELLSKDSPRHMGTYFTKTIHRTPSAAIDPTKVSLPDGYTVVIIGAGRGIGEFIAKAYAQAKASNIIITSRTIADLQRVKKELEHLAGGQSLRVSTIAADASVLKDYEKIADVITKEYSGRLDALICNAGGGEPFAAETRLHETDMDEYTKYTTLNYLAAYYAARQLIPFMLHPQSVGKLLLNITSGACHVPALRPTFYNIAKLALNRLTENIDQQYAQDGLIAIAVHPGGVLTPGSEKAAPQYIPFLKDDIRLCGAVCVWLSNTKPEWLSGRYMDVKWDVEELSAMKDEIVKDDKLKFRMVV